MKAPEIIYDDTPQVIYDDPIEKRENPYRSGELDEMFVDKEYRLRSNQLSSNVHGFLNELRAEFRGYGLVTYQDIMDYARRKVHFVPANYDYHSHPVITQWMNRLWKAGLVKKYRRGEYKRVVKDESKEGRGRSHGITYWIW